MMLIACVSLYGFLLRFGFTEGGGEILQSKCGRDENMFSYVILWIKSKRRNILNVCVHSFFKWFLQSNFSSQGYALQQRELCNNNHIQEIVLFAF